MSTESRGQKRQCNQPPSINSATISLKRSHNPSPAGVLRHRIPQPASSIMPMESKVDPKLSELLARFMVSQGIPFECVYDNEFQDLVQFFSPQSTLPGAKMLEAVAEKNGSPTRPKAAFGKSIGPLSVTLDIVSNADDNYLVFSIHYFEDFYTREHVVFLRKLMLSELDGESILICLRRAVNTYNYTNVKFSNILCPNLETSVLLSESDAIKRDYLCFFDYVSRFVALFTDIPEFVEGFEKLRRFVAYIKKHPDLYSMFRRTQLTKNDELDLPSIEEGSWFSMYTFLTRCLVLHQTFCEYATRCHLNNYISTETYNTLVFFQRILEQCATFCRDLSVPLNSISQVIPAVMLIRNFLTTHTRGFPFERQIRDCFSKVFREITSGARCERYDMAALLDPRYGYRDCIYSNPAWKAIETKLIGEIAKTETSSNERSLSNTFLRKSQGEKASIISAELQTYRKNLLDRPADTCDPFYWWGLRQTSMENLAVVAQEYLACPAITIDASHFFGEKGKMNRLCKAYNYQHLENCLNFAGYNQRFHGKGAFCDRNTPYPIGGFENHPTPKYLPTDGSTKVNVEDPVVESKVPDDDSFLERQVKEEIVEEEAAPAPARPKIIRLTAFPRSIVPVFPVRTIPRSALPITDTNQNVPIEQSANDSHDLDWEVKEEPMDEETKNTDLGELYASYCGANDQMSHSTKRERKPSNRRCSLCGNLEPHTLLKNVTVDGEKLMCILGAILREELTIPEARACFSKSTKTYYCRVHLTEACDDILSFLGVKTPSAISDALQLKIDNISETITFICGQQLPELRAYMIEFTDKYYKSCSSKSIPNVNLFEKFNSETDQNEIFQSEILPKFEREPRKQVLEGVSLTDATILQIEKEPFQLPNEPIDDEDLDETAETCCFCLSRKNRHGMVKVPNSVDRRARWTVKLGAAFARRLKPDGNYLCRKHFAPISFSSRGRLLKGQLPDLDETSVRITYKVDGASILKMHECKNKTDKDATVDLTVGETREWS